MRYMLKTELNSNGHKVFVKRREGKGYIYVIKDENGVISEVTKAWVLQNKDKIINLGVSKDSIYPIRSEPNTAINLKKVYGLKAVIYDDKYADEATRYVDSVLSLIADRLGIPRASIGLKGTLSLRIIVSGKGKTYYDEQKHIITVSDFKNAPLLIKAYFRAVISNQFGNSSVVSTAFNSLCYSLCLSQNKPAVYAFYNAEKKLKSIVSDKSVYNSLLAEVLKGRCFWNPQTRLPTKSLSLLLPCAAPNDLFKVCCILRDLRNAWVILERTAVKAHMGFIYYLRVLPVPTTYNSKKFNKAYYTFFRCLKEHNLF